MRKKLLAVVLIVLSFAYFSKNNLRAEKTYDLTTPPAVPELGPISEKDRVLILAPHPDDEALATGGIAQKAVKAGADFRIMYLTNGDHNQLAFIIHQKRLVIKQRAIINMGEIRQKEAVAAMKSLGVTEDKLIFLGYPDFGTLHIFLRYWGDAKPFKNMLTRTGSVLYKNVLSPNAPHKGESILRDIESVLKEYRPTKIFVTNPVDTNGDHKAYYLFLQVALWDLKDQIPEPEVYPYLVHCYGWPIPRNYHPQFYLEIPQMLRNGSIQWRYSPLTDEEIDKKYSAICLYKSQCSDSAFYLKAFARKNELFGDYPVIRLGRNQFETPPASVNSRVIYGRMDDNLKINLIFKRDSTRGRRFSVNLIGYRPDIDFSRMPKIKINVSKDDIRALDRGKFIEADGLSIQRKEHSFSMKVPLSVLGNPKYILASVNNAAVNLTSEVNAWRVIEIQ